jgi:hypothetical protein
VRVGVRVRARAGCLEEASHTMECGFTFGVPDLSLLKSNEVDRYSGVVHACALGAHYLVLGWRVELQVASGQWPVASATAP